MKQSQILKKVLEHRSMVESNLLTESPDLPLANITKDGVTEFMEEEIKMVQDSMQEPAVKADPLSVEYLQAYAEDVATKTNKILTIMAAFGTELPLHFITQELSKLEVPS